MNNIARIAIAAAAVLVVAILGYNLLPGLGGTGGQPTPPPTSVPTPATTPATTPAPLASPGPLPLGVELALSPGTYSFSTFPGITFVVPVGWFTCSDSAVEQAVCRGGSPGDPPIAVTFLIVDNVVADPCSFGEEPLDPPVGPSVDELVTAISNLEGFVASAPLDLTVDRYAGKEFTLTAPQNPGCDSLKALVTASRTTGMGLGEVNLVRILDVNGTRVVVTGAYNPGDPAPAERLAALNQVLASVRIEP